jgi:hypothetical protein
MSFGWFRKYEKTILWGTVVLSILIFATFSGLGDLQALLEGRDTEGEAGRFVVAGTGETHSVSVDEFLLTRNSLNRLLRSMGVAVEEDDVWRHLMLVEDARAAGMQVADSEVRRFITGGRPISKEEYRQVWMTRQFSSARELENLAREMILVERWVDFHATAAHIVDVDDVYVRWRVDNELFDFEAIAIPDVKPEDMPDPAEDELRAFYDGQTESYRASRYREPARHDLLYAWLPLDADTERVPDALIADLPAPPEAAVEGRFTALQPERWPEQDALDDAARAVLVRELRIAAHVQRVLGVYESLEEKSEEAFRATMEAAGLELVDPEGALDRQQIEALETVGDTMLPLWLSQKLAGQTHYQQPLGGQMAAAAFYVQAVEPSRELSYDEAHDKVLANWKEQRRDKRARDLRDSIRERTRALPEVAAIVEPIETAARERIEAAVAAEATLDEAGQQALRAELLDASEMAEVRPRIAEHERQVWETLELPDGARKLTLTDVPRTYYSEPDDALEAADSVERFVKSNTSLFRLAVGSVSETLRHAASGQSVLVLVTGRRYPDQSVMLADAEGMTRSRGMLATQRESEVRQGFVAERVKVAHQLQLPVRTEETAGTP